MIKTTTAAEAFESVAYLSEGTARLLEIFMDGEPYGSIPAYHNIVHWCRIQDPAGLTARRALEIIIGHCEATALIMFDPESQWEVDWRDAYVHVADDCRQIIEDAWGSCQENDKESEHDEANA